MLALPLAQCPEAVKHGLIFSATSYAESVLLVIVHPAPKLSAVQHTATSDVWSASPPCSREAADLGKREVCATRCPFGYPLFFGASGNKFNSNPGSSAIVTFSPGPKNRVGRFGEMISTVSVSKSIQTWMTPLA